MIMAENPTRGFYHNTGTYSGFRYYGNLQSQPAKVQTRPVIHVGTSPPKSKPRKPTRRTKNIPDVPPPGTSHKWIIVVSVVTIILIGLSAGIITGVILSNKGTTTPPDSYVPTTSTTSIVTLLTLKSLQFQSSYNDLQSNDSMTLTAKICNTYVTVLANITSGKLTGCAANNFSNGSVVSRNQLIFAATDLNSLATDVNVTVHNDITNHDGLFPTRFNSSRFEFAILPAVVTEKPEVSYTTVTPVALTTLKQTTKLSALSTSQTGVVQPTSANPLSTNQTTVAIALTTLKQTTKLSALLTSQTGVVQPTSANPPSTSQTTVANCSSSKYQCANTIICVEYTTWCDGVTDCPNGSDELPGCNAFCPREAIHYCAQTQKCIFQVQKCDRYQDCPDDFDESNCTCDLAYQYGCFAGRCIYKEWLCDGVKDCPFGDDESPPQCNATCDNRSQFTCSRGHSCVMLSQLCDGKPDCSDSSDEANCVSSISTTGVTTVTQAVRVTHRGTYGNYICADNWNAAWSDFVCQNSGYGFSVQTAVFPLGQTSNSSQFLTVEQSLTNVSIFAAFSIASNCSGKVVAINCAPHQCGIRTVPSGSVGPYIINGQVAARGAWPWQVKIYNVQPGSTSFYNFRCGGILIAPSWILTAGQCTQANPSVDGYSGQLKATGLSIIAGAIHLSTDPDSVELHVSSVFTHPKFDPTNVANDIGLLKLVVPAVYSDTIRPICLPTANADLSQYRVCVSTGFGYTTKSTLSPNLLQAKMNIMPDDVCSTQNPFFQNASEMCIGSLPGSGDNNNCVRDTGGPLSCQDQQGMWTAVGVHSYRIGSSGGTTATDSCKLSVAARLPPLVGWINSVTWLPSDTVCSASQFRCLNGPCIDYTKWCNGAVDCPGGDDEMTECKNFCPKEAVHFCNATQSCVFPVQRCDQYQDCPDDFDESNCPCDPTFQYGCTNGRCIYKEWLCDGVKDCPNGDDESSCNVCDVTANFTCNRGKACIPASSVCDGVSDCTDSSDEAHCFSGSDNSTSSRISKMIYKGTPGNYICADNWNSTWSELLCQRIGYACASGSLMFPVNASENFVSIDRLDSNSSLISQFTKSKNCSGNAMNLTCSPYGCGKRSVLSDSVGPYIINGQRAAYGAWPWQVAINFGSSFCGGVLIKPNWVLTAAHCTLIGGSQVSPSNVQITLGSLHRSTTDIPNAVRVTVSNVYTHPNYDSVAITNDVGLYKLSSPVTYSDNIRPICLPDANVDLNQFKVCVSTGWGKTIKDTLSNDLLQTKMNTMTRAACAAAGNPGINYTVDICVGSVPGVGENNICQGDSGGPFACQDQNDRWTVIGVHSFTIGIVGTSAYNVCRTSVVARVSAFLDWISRTIIT